MDTFLMYFAGIAECTLMASFCVMILVCYLYESPDTAEVMRNITFRIISVLPEFDNAPTDATPKVASHNLINALSTIELADSKLPMDFTHESINKRNGQKLVVPPVIGQIRKSPRVHVNSTLLVKRCRERPIDKDKTFVAPAKNVQRKVTFLFNNMTEINYQSKGDELKCIVFEEHFPWLSNYMIMDRLSLESCYHDVYIKLLDYLKNKALNSFITLETVRNIRNLLKRDKRRVTPIFGLLLNNLGRWLGMITIRKNTSITSVFGDLNSILVEAYSKGDSEIHFIVPFITAILESCAHSKAFNTRNPWTISVLNCLAELHQKPDLKPILKVKIEVLCKHLNVELKDLKSDRCLLDSPCIDKN